MKKRPIPHMIFLIGVLILLLLLMFARGSLQRPVHITLPSPDAVLQPDQQAPENEQLELVEVRPDTVQQAVASMERADSYTMTVRVETLWSGGSGTEELLAYVRDGVTRIDALQLDGSMRRTLTDGESTYLWYDGEEEYITYPTEDVTADREFRILTYEDLVALPVDAIKEADYQELKGVYCIYAEAEEERYISQYWVDVATGLLIAAQRLENGQPVYQMTVQSMDVSEQPAELFVLPDGVSLLTE